MKIDILFSIISKMFFTDCFYIIWFITAIYISKVRKYKFDTEYSAATDKLKFYWVMMIYGSIVFSYILISEIFKKNTIKFLLYFFISMVAIMVSFVLLLRLFNKDSKRYAFISKIKIFNFQNTKPAIIVTNIIVVLYSVLFSLCLEFQ